jgi:hypothetical protein
MYAKEIKILKISLKLLKNLDTEVETYQCVKFTKCQPKISSEILTRICEVYYTVD